jgi:hypothetical protein
MEIKISLDLPLLKYAASLNIEKLARILRKKYSKENHLVGKISLSPKKGKQNVMPRRIVSEKTNIKLVLLLYLDDKQKRDPIIPKNKNRNKPKVFANLSRNGGNIADIVEIVSGLYKSTGPVT